MNAQDIIEKIAETTDIATMSKADLARGRYALEDGAALAALGFGDDDQDAVEEAHALVAAALDSRS